MFTFSTIIAVEVVIAVEVILIILILTQSELLKTACIGFLINYVMLLNCTAFKKAYTMVYHSASKYTATICYTFLISFFYIYI